VWDLTRAIYRQRSGHVTSWLFLPHRLRSHGARGSHRGRSPSGEPHIVGVILSGASDKGFHTAYIISLGGPRNSLSLALISWAECICGPSEVT